MRDGKLLQIGTPDEIYNRRPNLRRQFTAPSPPTNSRHAHRAHGNSAAVDFGDGPASEAALCNSSIPADKGAGWFAARKHCDAAGTDDANAFTASVVDRRYQGRNYAMTSDLFGHGSKCLDLAPPRASAIGSRRRFVLPRGCWAFREYQVASSTISYSHRMLFRDSRDRSESGEAGSLMETAPRSSAKDTVPQRQYQMRYVRSNHDRQVLTQQVKDLEQFERHGGRKALERPRRAAGALTLPDMARADRHHLLLAPGQIVRPRHSCALSAGGKKLKICSSLPDHAMAAVGLCARGRPSDRFSRTVSPRKQDRALRRTYATPARSNIGRRQAGDILAFEIRCCRCGRHQPGQRLEQRRLTGAVAAE